MLFIKFSLRLLGMAAFRLQKKCSCFQCRSSYHYYIFAIVQLNYVLDRNRPPTEIIIKDGKTFLTREDFWTLGWSQCLESNVSFMAIISVYCGYS